MSRQQFFSHVGKFSWVEPVLSNEGGSVLLKECLVRHSTNRANGAPWMKTCRQLEISIILKVLYTGL